MVCNIYIVVMYIALKMFKGKKKIIKNMERNEHRNYGG